MKKNYIFFTTLALLLIAFKSSAQTDNTFSGTGAGANSTGNFNTGFGVDALKDNASHSNNAFGARALSVTIGGFNSAFGNESLRNNTTGTLNSAFGTRSLFSNVSGQSNIAFGHRAMEANVSGSGNTAIGYGAMLKAIGNNNVALGVNTPRNLVSGNNNVFIGAETGKNLINGSNNLFLGNVALEPALTSAKLAGTNTDGTIILADGLGNQRFFVSKFGNAGLGLGNNVIPANRLDVNGGVVIGKNYVPSAGTTTATTTLAPTNGLLVEGKVGIGNRLPNNKVEITHGVNGNSGLRFTNLTSQYTPPVAQTSTKFLTVNANGDVVLQRMAGLTNTNVMSSNANLMTTNVNSVTASAPIVNSISNIINSSNQLITSVNGVASAPVNLPQSLDNSVTNELQTLSQVGNTITLSNGGGSVTILPIEDTDTDQQSLGLTGNVLSISNGNSVTLPTVTPQTLTQSGNTITLSNGGGSVVIPPYIDTNTDQQSLFLSGQVLSISNGNSVTLPAQTLSQSGNTISLSNGGGSVVIPPYVDTNTDEQVLSITGNVLSISNGNSVVLPNHGPQSITQNGAIVTLSNGGGSITLQSSIVTAGTNVNVLGNGTAGTPYVVSATDTSLYADNGAIDATTTISGNRVVNMNNSNIWFNTANSSSNAKIYLGSTASYPNTTGNYKLFVEGGILTEKVKVALRSSANWADYVFAKDYKLMPLKEVEKFVTANKHLPGIDSAEVLAKNGLDVAEMQSKQMEKIEELTLYIIDQDKKIEAQDKAIEKNNKEIEELKALVQALMAKTK
ncbi:beta strand repeat-containing protein [Flavobacterium terrisoli]|uniref:beta strand repeat-containing protein n=1 Tax=Flavobacterium terrisoli TaxID=3242195 RepID=UPI002542B2CD|nr:hypothetical protein [Flavobacterium buctense]